MSEPPHPDSEQSKDPARVRRQWTPLIHSLTSRPVRAVLLVLLLGALVEQVPALESVSFLQAPSAPSKPTFDEARPVDASQEARVGEVQLEAESRTLPGMALDDAARAPTVRGPIGGREAPLDLPAIAAEAPPVPLVDPSGSALDEFFAALVETAQDKPGAITRIAHFGDSIVVSDYVSGTLRRQLQEAFGDAGHGYMLVANAWPAYFHNDVFRFATAGFSVSRIVGPLTKDGLYGLGGVTFRARRGAIAQWGTAEKGEFGRQVSRFTFSYLAQPHGGSFELWVDGEVDRTLSSESESTQVRRETIEVTDGEHRFELRHRDGETRSFGVVLERNEPGVVLDALGVQGARIRFLDKQDDEHFADELRWRQPDLLIFQFGANESGDGYAYPMDEYLRTMKDVIEQTQSAVPSASCLIIGAMDRARVENGLTTSMKIIQLIVEQQRIAANDLGCAYFDTYESMGGWGSMPSWVRRGLGQADMTHPTGVGAIRIGGWIYRALMKEYDGYLERQKTGR